MDNEVRLITIKLEFNDKNFEKLIILTAYEFEVLKQHGFLTDKESIYNIDINTFIEMYKKVSQYKLDTHIINAIVLDHIENHEKIKINDLDAKYVLEIRKYLEDSRNRFHITTGIANLNGKIYSVVHRKRESFYELQIVDQEKIYNNVIVDDSDLINILNHEEYIKLPQYVSEELLMKTPKDKVTLTLYIDKKLHKEFTKLCSEEQKFRTLCGEEAIQMWVEAKKKEKEKKE